MVKIGLIPAAGAGVRAYPATHYLSKVMLEIEGKPLILRNIELLRDKLGIKEIYIIVGYLQEQIKHFLGDGSQFGVTIHYILCNQHTVGLAQGILLARDYLTENFVTILGDEIYLHSNHEQLKDFKPNDYEVVCGLMQTDDLEMITKNYTVEITDNKITALFEKPKTITSNLLGCGTYLFTPALFQAIEATQPSPASGKVELTEVINNLAQQGQKVYPFFLQGSYHNINSVEDYNFANYAYRSMFFNNFKVSVIVPAFNEAESIGAVVKDFINQVDEVLVIDNSSQDETKIIATNLGARVETVNLKGYGDTIRYGLDQAKGDILVIVEADHSFRAKDLDKFLAYLKDADMVIGTRTTRQMIEQGANMQGLLRWGNVAVGKLVEILWWNQDSRFTDVGCTYRAIWKEAYKKIRDHLQGTGPEFSPEMMIAVLQARKRVIEIPISYYKRLTGISKHSENYFKISKTALKMLKMIFKKRFNL